MNTAYQVKNDLLKLTNPQKAQFLQGFFKTGKGGYAEGDKFLGITVPEQRKIAKKYYELSLDEIQKLLEDKLHEVRLTALVILVNKFEGATEKERSEIYNFYLKNTKNINNWDLVDLSAPKIIGAYLLDKNRNILYKLTESKSLWERRIAIVSCYTFIKGNDLTDALKISGSLLLDKEDLIHKATGWMLREVGKQNKKVLEQFLKKHSASMPRTMLRYSIEKFTPDERQIWLKK